MLSQADTQLSGVAVTDGDGRYTTYKIAVGPLNVRASKGDSLGHSAGRLDRAGTTATVNVTMDGGQVSVSGTVRRAADGVTAPVPGANVVYWLQKQGITPDPPLVKRLFGQAKRSDHLLTSEEIYAIISETTPRQDS